MKKHFRVLAAALALCMSLLCCPAALAATDTSTFQTVPYSQATAQPSGQRITITGKPNYSAATGNDTAFIFGFDTADGVWYVAVKKSKFEAFKAAAPAQQMTLYGVYAGTLNVNGMPILDIQNGAVTLGDKTSEIADLYAAGQKTLDFHEQQCYDPKEHEHHSIQEEYQHCFLRQKDGSDGLDPDHQRAQVPQQSPLQRYERPGESGYFHGKGTRLHRLQKVLPLKYGFCPLQTVPKCGNIALGYKT